MQRMRTDLNFETQTLIKASALCFSNNTKNETNEKNDYFYSCYTYIDRNNYFCPGSQKRSWKPFLAKKNLFRYSYIARTGLDHDEPFVCHFPLLRKQ